MPSLSETALRWRILLAAGVAAGALIGFGIVMWVAANWSDMHRMTRFALVGGGLAAGCLGAMVHSSARIPGALVAFLAIGGLFALFGQTYQSGADPWQLFALWAALGLPLALAARHDTLWAPWTVVAYTGLLLWARPNRSWFSSMTTDADLTDWALAIALLAGLFGVDRLLAPPGQARWAFRFGALLTMGLIAADGMDALTSTSVSLGMFGYAMLFLLLLATAFYFVRPMEFGLTTAAALAMDVLLILLLARIILSRSALADPGGFLGLGILSGGVIAGTAALLLRLPRRIAPAEQAETPDAAASDARTWPVTVLSGIGALLSTAPLLVFIGLAFGSMLSAWPVTIGMGAVLLFAAILLIRTAAPLTFRQQFGFILMTMAYALLTWGLFTLMKSGNAALVMAVLLLLGAIVCPSGWIRTLLGGAMAFALGIWIEMTMLGVRDVLHLRGRTTLLILAVAAAAGLLMAQRFTSKDRNGVQGLFGSLLTGFCAVTIIALAVASGRTFLFGGGLWGETGVPPGSGSLANWSIWRNPGLLPGIGALALLLWRGGPALRYPPALALGGVALVLSALTANLGPALLLMATAFVTGHRVLAALAAGAALWIIGAFYYWLGWTLTEKAALMIGLGLALAVLAELGRRAASDSAASSGLAPGIRTAFALPLIASSGIAAAAIAGLGIRDKEALIATGRPVYVALAPVDPRSLMQGDYMALRFALPTSDSFPGLPVAGTPYGVATVDARNLATIKRIAYGPPNVAADEIALRMKIKNRRLMLGTDAWFFKEGSGKKFEAARFGEFRVGRDGELILVGMADKDLQILR